MTKIFILHENREWLEPLAAELARRGLPFEEWHMHDTYFDLSAPPPRGVFYSRMSASAHTRGHRYAPEFTAAVLAWLEHHRRRVLNPGRALRLELSKVEQYAALAECGIRTPKTCAALGRGQIIEAARRHFSSDAFIVKHNRAGKGLGVRLFYAVRALEEYVESDEFEPSVDGITLVQEYVESADPFITRCEFVGQEFLYAVRVDNTQGFLLCPADGCDAESDPSTDGAPLPPRFRIEAHFDEPIIDRYASFLKRNDIHIAGIEFIVDRRGVAYTYDVNINTNYNRDAEQRAGVSGMRAIVDCLQQELNRCAGAAPIAVEDRTA